MHAQGKGDTNYQSSHTIIPVKHKGCGGLALIVYKKNCNLSLESAVNWTLVISLESTSYTMSD